MKIVRVIDLFRKWLLQVLSNKPLSILPPCFAKCGLKCVSNAAVYELTLCSFSSLTGFASCSRSQRSHGNSWSLQWFFLYHNQFQVTQFEWDSRLIHPRFVRHFLVLNINISTIRKVRFSYYHEIFFSSYSWRPGTCGRIHVWMLRCWPPRHFPEEVFRKRRGAIENVLTAVHWIRIIIFNAPSGNEIPVRVTDVCPMRPRIWWIGDIQRRLSF